MFCVKFLLSKKLHSIPLRFKDFSAKFIHTPSHLSQQDTIFCTVYVESKMLHSVALSISLKTLYFSQHDTKPLTTLATLYVYTIFESTSVNRECIENSLPC